jgi:hypothetical protein
MHFVAKSIYNSTWCKLHPMVVTMPSPNPTPIRKPVPVQVQTRIHLELPNGLVSRNVLLIASGKRAA